MNKLIRLTLISIFVNNIYSACDNCCCCCNKKKPNGNGGGGDSDNGGDTEESGGGLNIDGIIINPLSESQKDDDVIIGFFSDKADCFKIPKEEYDKRSKNKGPKKIRPRQMSVLSKTRNNQYIFSKYKEPETWDPNFNTIVPKIFSKTATEIVICDIGSDFTRAVDMFSDCKEAEAISFKNVDTSQIVTMKGMFDNCKKVKKLDLSSFNTKNGKDMSGMFSDCVSLEEVNLSSFDTSRVYRMANMFSGCANITELNLQNFSTGVTTDMTGMFKDCSNLKKIIFGDKFVMKDTLKADEMFFGCNSLECVIIDHKDKNLEKYLETAKTNKYDYFIFQDKSSGHVEESGYYRVGCFNKYKK